MNTITEALGHLGETLAKKGFSALDLNCEDDEDVIMYALTYMENHLDDILESVLEDQDREAK